MTTGHVYIFKPDEEARFAAKVDVELLGPTSRASAPMVITLGRPISADAMSIVQDADWLPHTFDASGEQLVFVHAPAELRRRLPFLTPECLADRPKTSVPLSGIYGLLSELPSVPTHFIFHTAFCGSTLLANALDAAGVAAGLKEPAVLLNLHFRFGRAVNAAEHDRLDLALKLLSRPIGGAQAVVAKPSCFANPLIQFIMRDSPQSKAVMLHSDLRTFLLAIAKRGIGGRSWGRQAFASSRENIPVEFGISAEELLTQTDLQVAALAWLMRLRLFEKIASEFGSSRVLPLKSTQLYDQPLETLEQVAGFLGQETPRQLLQPVVEGDVFRKHSKETNRHYGPDERASEEAALTREHGEEVQAVVGWAKRVARERGFALGNI